MSHRWLLRICIVVLLLSLATLGIWSSWTNGQTTDEAFFSASGYSMLRYNNYEFLGEHPPLILQLGGLPLLALQPRFPINDPLYVSETDRLDLTQNGLRFLYQMGNDPNLILFLQRVPVVLLTVILGLGIFLMATDLWGKWGGILSLALFAFDPNMIAHGSLYTTDMGLTVFYFFSIYALKRFFDAPSSRTVLWLGVACGAAFMSKISGLILLPVITTLFVVYYFNNKTALGAASLSPRFGNFILCASLFLIANQLGEKQAMVLFGPFSLFAVYLFARDLGWLRNSCALRRVFRAAILAGGVLCVIFSWKLKKKYGISSATVMTIGSLAVLFLASAFARLPSRDNRIRLLKCYSAVFVLASLFIVLDYTDIIYKFHRFIGFGNYMKPLGIVLSHSAGGHGACVEGSFVTCDWRYFPAVMAVKTPLLTLVLSGLGALALFFSGKSVTTKSLILMPVVFFLAAAIPNKIHIGLRHILPIYPFLFLLAGYAGSLIAKIRFAGLRNFVAAILCILVIASSARNVMAGPDYLAYFNAWVGGPSQGAKLLADSNLNWGQDNRKLAEFVLKEKIPAIKIATEAENSSIYDYYKISWSRVSAADLKAPTPGVYALGIGIYTGLQKDPASWFHNREPEYRVGKTFYVFEVPQSRPGVDRPQTATATGNIL